MKVNLKYKEQKLDFDKRSLPALIVFLVLLMFGLILYFSWRSGRTPDEEVAKKDITVVTTIFPLYDMVRNVVGEEDNIKVVQIISSGSSPHTFEPSIQNREDISNADIVFIVGAGFDDWVKEMIEDDTNIIDLSEYVDLSSYENVTIDTKMSNKISKFGTSCMQFEGIWLSPYNECENITKEQCSQIGGTFDECASSCRNLDKEETACIQVCVPVCKFKSDKEKSEGGSAEKDPHFWLSIENAKKIVTEIYNNITSLSENNAQELYNNTIRYLTSLDETKQYISSRAEIVQENQLITYHNSFEYFAREFGFEIVATFEEHEGQEPSAKYLTELISIVEEYQISTLYKQPQMSDEVLSAFAEDNDLEIKTLDPLGGGERTGSYIDILLFNIHSIAGSETEGS